MEAAGVPVPAASNAGSGSEDDGVEGEEEEELESDPIVEEKIEPEAEAPPPLEDLKGSAVSVPAADDREALLAVARPTKKHKKAAPTDAAVTDAAAPTETPTDPTVRKEQAPTETRAAPTETRATSTETKATPTETTAAPTMEVPPAAPTETREAPSKTGDSLSEKKLTKNPAMLRLKHIMADEASKKRKKDVSHGKGEEAGVRFEIVQPTSPCVSNSTT